MGCLHVLSLFLVLALVNLAFGKNLFFSKESFEVDSSEHGVLSSPGKKSPTCSCGWANRDRVRVVNGKTPNENQYPFIVSLVIRYTKNPICAGVIITPLHVLTAGHCTYNQLANNLNIIYKEHQWNRVSDARAVPVAKYVSHENFKRHNLDYDISLLILGRKIPFSNLAGPACLPNPNEKLNLVGKYVKLIGWGLTTHRGNVSTILQEVNLRVVDMKKCIDVPNLHILKSTYGRNQFCTYGTKRGGCNGDSGGPVVWLDPDTNRYVVVGLVSFGDICGGPMPSVNVEVQAYSDWIEKQIQENQPETTCLKPK